MAFVITNAIAIEPLELQVEKAREVVTRIENIRAVQQGALVFYRENTDGLVIKYLINMPVPQQPIFIKNEKQLLKFSQPALFVTSTENFLALSAAAKAELQIIFNAKMAHQTIVVFMRKGIVHE